MQPGDVIGDAVRFAEASEITVDRALVARGGLYEFVKLAWPLVGKGSTFIDNGHVRVMCQHLEGVTRGEIKLLIINVPPGCSKSTVVSILWPAWEWIQFPSRKWICAAAGDRLVRRDAVACRQLIESPWFQERWGDEVAIIDSDGAQRTQAIFETTAGGRRLSVTVGSNQTIGWHGDRHVIDDPHDPEAMRNPELAENEIERVWSWWTNTLAGRVANPKVFAQVVIMQRLGDNDLVARLLETAGDRAVHVVMPMRFEPEMKCKTQWGEDLRTEPGQLLVPDRYDEASVCSAEQRMGSQVAAAQLQQRPAPAGGNILQREWFKERWTVLPAGLMLIQSWDCTFKDKATSDFVAGHVWGYLNGKYYLIDRIHDRMGMPAVCTCIKTLLKRFPRARGKLIEDKANGPAVEQTLRGEVSGIIMVEPMGGKVARANAIAPLVEAGNVVIPDTTAKLKLASGTELTYEWADDLIEDLVKFPFARHDDDMDAMSQAVIYLHDHMQPSYVDAVRKIAAGKVKFT